jgi:hypothetical protein
MWLGTAPFVYYVSSEAHPHGLGQVPSSYALVSTTVVQALWESTAILVITLEAVFLWGKPKHIRRVLGL